MKKAGDEWPPVAKRKLFAKSGCLDFAGFMKPWASVHGSSLLHDKKNIFEKYI